MKKLVCSVAFLAAFLFVPAVMAQPNITIRIPGQPAPRVQAQAQYTFVERSGPNERRDRDFRNRADCWYGTWAGRTGWHCGGLQHWKSCSNYVPTPRPAPRPWYR